MNARWFNAIALTLSAAVSGSVSAQDKPQTPSQKFAWRPGELPGPFWVVRTREPCLNVQASGGMWRTKSVVTLTKETRRDWVCSYTWSSPNRLPDLPALQRLPGAVVEADPPIVLPNSDPERDLKWFGPLNALARARLAIPDDRPQHDERNGVRVVVLDTAADTARGVLDPVGHGRAVGRLIDELACGKLDPCATEVRHLSALPFVSDPAHGSMSLVEQGAIGTRGTLAAAIESASNEWASMPASSRPRHLVLNLSVGWSGCWEEDIRAQLADPSSIDVKRGVGSDSVYQSILRATCRGALVVAASGNGQPDLGCPTNPPAPGEPRFMFPGLWGGARVDRTLCERIGVPAVFEGNRPLLVGVSGVDQHDNLLSVAGSGSDLVGFAQYPTFPDPSEPSGWTLPLSGTSMSAAAFSGIAAAVLGVKDMSVPELLALTRETSVPLALDPAATPDFICNQRWNGEPCKDVRRLSLCNALSKLQPGLRCSTPEAARESSVGFQTMSPLALAGAATAVDCDDCGAAPCPQACDIPIGPELDSQSGPWVVPQPKPPGCTTCAMVPLLPIFQGEFHYPVGSLVLIVRRLIGPDVRVALQDAQVPALVPTTWLLPLSTLGGISARLVYRASSSLAKESGDVIVTSVPPFTIPCGILGPCP